ncbi:MAG: pantoate--beta-alanine ligase [Candidatus Zixiibacteriota bacterium]
MALVPTMGFLHEGHLALVDRARKAADKVVVSIFVNPAQFGPREDLKSYPRDTRRDLRLLRQRGADFVFLPTVAEIYPAGYETYVEVESLGRRFEGESRPGHFRGVTTIVAKLFNICRPDAAVFGQKDYQQAMVLRKLAEDLGYPLKFIIAPTVREPSGLALSSRNSYFTPEQRAEAACLYRGLRATRLAFRSGEKRPAELARTVRREARSVCGSVKFDYVALTEFTTLRPLKVAQKGAVISLAAKVHGVRLIDNIRL